MPHSPDLLRPSRASRDLILNIAVNGASVAARMGRWGSRPTRGAGLRRSACPRGARFWRPGRIVRVGPPDTRGDFRMIPRFYGTVTGCGDGTILPKRHFPWSPLFLSFRTPGPNPVNFGARTRGRVGAPHHPRVHGRSTPWTAPAAGPGAPSVPPQERRVRPATGARIGGRADPANEKETSRGRARTRGPGILRPWGRPPSGVAGRSAPRSTDGPGGDTPGAAGGLRRCRGRS